MPDSRYFELRPEIGVAPAYLNGPDGPVENPAAGAPDVISSIAVPLAKPTMVDGKPRMVVESVKLDAIPGTRIVKTSDAQLVNALIASEFFSEVDAPDKKALASARKDTEDARAASKEN